MANYTSKHTGAQIDTGVDIYKVFSYVSASTSVTVGSSAVNFSAIAWTAEPKNNNTVYGIAFHPGTGALYWIKSINGAKTGVLFSSGSLTAQSDGDHTHTVNLAENTVVTGLNPTSTKYKWTLDTTDKTEQVIKSIDATTKKLVTTSIIPAKQASTEIYGCGTNKEIHEATLSTNTIYGVGGEVDVWGLATKTENNTTVVDTTTASKATVGTDITIKSGLYETTTSNNQTVADTTKPVTQVCTASVTGTKLTLTPISVMPEEKTVTPYTLTDVTVPKAASASSTVATKDSTATTVGNANYKSAVTTVATKAATATTVGDATLDTAVTVATGAVGDSDTNGATVAVGLDAPTKETVLKSTATSISATEDNSGLSLVTSVTPVKNAVNDAGTATSAGAHTHTVS